LHFWVGSFCGVLDNTGNSKATFPRQVVAASDTIALIEDMGNQIPDKSWMLYLLELFSNENIAIELNLICQFDNQDYFEAIFNGVNRYRFKEILPLVGHSYLRQIIMNSQIECISYLLEDRNTMQTERFDLQLNTREELSSFAFKSSNLFTGIEWWNKIGNFPYPIRYHIQVSQLMYGISDNPSDAESIVFGPFNTLTPNSEGMNMQYPFSFHNPRMESGCICYNIKSGNCKYGMQYPFL